MIDLSYLTEDEQEMILSVLKRDAELKHKEEQRIKKLQKTEQDKSKLKYLTGEWFYETKSNRHRDKIPGSEMIRASMTRRKPVTIMELTQIWPGKSSFLKCESKDIYIPPELSGLIGEASSSAYDNREDHYQGEEYKPSTHPQTKARQNPFNSKPIGLDSPVKTDGHLQTGVKIQQIPGNSHQVPADQQPAVESLSSPPKPYRASQIPAEDHHEDLAEPHSSQVSEPSDSLVEQGKVNQLSTEAQCHTLTEEDESSISKVLGWVGMMSKGNERPGVQEEQIREGPAGSGTPHTENASHTRTEIKAKPSPKLRMGPLGLLLGKDRVETSECLLDKDDVDYVCRPDGKQDNIILGCSAQNSASGLNFVTEELEANPCLSMIDDRSDNLADDHIQRRESLYQDEGSQNRHASLMSFWESRNKEPKVLSTKKKETNENKVSGRKISKVEFYLSPSKAKSFNYTDICESYKGFSESHNRTRHNISVIPFVEEKTSSFDTGQKPHEHGIEIESTTESLISPTKQMEIYKLKETYSPVLSVRKAITEGTTSTSPNRVESPETSISFSNRELGELKASSKGKLDQRSKRVTVNSPLDGTDRTSYNRSPFKTCMLGSDERIKFSPVSYPIRNISSVSQDHGDQSTGDPMKILEQSRILSPRHMPEIMSRGLYPVKESRMVGSPNQRLRAFPIAINPTEKTPLKGLEHTPRGQTRYPHGLSSPGKDGKLLAERLEEHILSLRGNTSGKNIQRQLIPQHSAPCFGSSQAPGTICIGNISSKQASPVHPLSVSQRQTSVQLITSTDHHRKITSKRSVEGIKDVIPVVLTEQMQLDGLQCKTSVHLSCQHPLSLAESTHVSGFSDQPAKQQWAGVHVCESSQHMSPSLKSQSEITRDSSSSTSAEAWSLSRTSSACDNEGPSLVRRVQKQANIRPLSISKSLEDLVTLPTNERWKNEPSSGIIQTVEEVSDAFSSSLLDPEQSKRLSVSVPAFMHEQGNGKGSDCLSVNSFCSERQRKSSTNTNASASSGLTSMSSVSGSVTNIYGTDLGHVEVKGTIQFAINYVNKLGELHIFIVQCQNLAVAEPKRNRSDPYVKCYLLPDKAKLGKRKTSVKKKTRNPTYNEILRYKVPLESVKVHTLNVSVWHNDTFGRNSFLGEVNVDLSEWDNNTHMMELSLKGRIATPNSPKHVNHSMEVCGDMRISLRFLLRTSQSDKTPQTGEIQVWVKECMNLPSRSGSIDPFVKCSVLPDSHQKNRQRTRVVKRTANPVFNHTMVYDGLRLEDLKDTCVELTVWDHDRLSNHFIGGIRLGLGTGKSHSTEVKWMDSNIAESALWRKMIESKNEWVEDTVPLRMLIMAR